MTRTYDGEKRLALRIEYPYKALIVRSNDYGLSIGKGFIYARRKEGNASPYPIEIYSYGGNYRTYQMKEDEVLLSKEEIM